MIKKILFCLSFFLQLFAERSFDVFDTLIGRLHYHPHSVFDLVEKKFPYPGFKSLRISSEIQSNGTLEDIYRNVKRLSGENDELINKLMEFEINIDSEYTFPILENINLIRDNDLLISDTYYNETHLKQLLEKNGFNKKVKYIVSPSGKSSGRVFCDLRKKMFNGVHLGDNRHSDFYQPINHGIKAIHFKDSDLTDIEKFLEGRGNQQLAYFIRAVRLSNPYRKESTDYFIWNSQSQYNLPVLVLSAFYIKRYALEKKFNKILFTTRDCCLLKKIFDSLFPSFLTEVFHSSRKVLYNPSSFFINYVKNIYDQNCLIVDLQGTGNSIFSFFNKYLEIDPNVLYLIGHQISRKYPAILTNGSDTIEKFNYDIIGPLIDFTSDGPKRDNPVNEVDYIDVAHSTIKKALDFLHFYEFSLGSQNLIKDLSFLMQKSNYRNLFNHKDDYSGTFEKPHF